MFVDELTIHAKAGRGGNGVVRWLHEKGKEYGGPAGGDGGRGGDIIFRAVRDTGILGKYRGKNTFVAKNGEHGKSMNMAGHDGESVTVEIPVGSIVRAHSSGKSVELLDENATYVALKGGRGGLGNTNFKSSTNQNPEEFTEGEAGEEDTFTVELKLIADAGFIGLPNAGKSSLLNSLTSAKAKVGNYAFTTLSPNLGVLYGYVLADIPGLIEGAHEGRGLGDSFLRHVARTRILIHCVSADSVDPQRDYETVRSEITQYDAELSRKPEIVFVTKADTVSEQVLGNVMSTLKTKNPNVIPVSILDDSLLKKAGETITSFLEA